MVDCGAYIAVAEERAIWDVVCSVSAYSFRSSKWNKNPNINGGVIIKIRENLEYDREFFEDYEPDWRYVMWFGAADGDVQQNAKCSFVDCCDDDVDFERPVCVPDDKETHAILSLALEGNASEEALIRCTTYANIRFIQTLKKFLRLLRLLAFS